MSSFLTKIYVLILRKFWIRMTTIKWLQKLSTWRLNNTQFFAGMCQTTSSTRWKTTSLRSSTSTTAASSTRQHELTFSQPKPPSTTWNCNKVNNSILSNYNNNSRENLLFYCQWQQQHLHSKQHQQHQSEPIFSPLTESATTSSATTTTKWTYFFTTNSNNNSNILNNNQMNLLFHQHLGNLFVRWPLNFERLNVGTGFK